MCVLLVEKQITLAALFFNGNLRRAFGILGASKQSTQNDNTAFRREANGATPPTSGRYDSAAH